MSTLFADASATDRRPKREKECRRRRFAGVSDVDVFLVDDVTDAIARRRVDEDGPIAAALFTALEREDRVEAAARGKFGSTTPPSTRFHVRTHGPGWMR